MKAGQTDIGKHSRIEWHDKCEYHIGHTLLCSLVKYTKDKHYFMKAYPKDEPFTLKSTTKETPHTILLAGIKQSNSRTLH